MSLREFNENRQRLPATELAKYVGQYVAWHSSGSHIIAANPDEFELYTAIKLAGLDPGDTLVSYIPPLDEVVLGSEEVN